jgi:hypothetical protein
MITGNAQQPAPVAHHSMGAVHRLCAVFTCCSIAYSREGPWRKAVAILPTELAARNNTVLLVCAVPLVLTALLLYLVIKT